MESTNIVELIRTGEGLKRLKTLFDGELDYVMEAEKDYLEREQAFRESLAQVGIPDEIMEEALRTASLSHLLENYLVASCAVEVLNPHQITDITCGEGIASIIAERLGVKKVIGYDINKRAIENAKTKARRVGSKAEFYASNFYELETAALGSTVMFHNANEKFCNRNEERVLYAASVGEDRVLSLEESIIEYAIRSGANLAFTLLSLPLNTSNLDGLDIRRNLQRKINYYAQILHKAGYDIHRFATSPEIGQEVIVAKLREDMLFKPKPDRVMPVGGMLHL